MTGRQPYAYFLQDTIVIANVQDGTKPARDRCLPAIFSDSLWTLLEKCWDYDPRDRPNITAVRQRLEEM